MSFGLALRWHPRAFLAPKTLNRLVIDNPALTTGVVLGRPEAATAHGVNVKGICTVRGRFMPQAPLTPIVLFIPV